MQGLGSIIEAGRGGVSSTISALSSTNFNRGEISMAANNISDCCSWVGCSNPGKLKGYCSIHFPIRNQQRCSVSNCSRKFYGKSYCAYHYKKWYKHGDPLFIRPGAESRFWDFVKLIPNGCWEWQGSTNGRYGKLLVDKKHISAHRYSFWLHKGFWPMPCCRHVCDNKKCVNPEHLVPGTAKENAQDAVTRNRQCAGERNAAAKLKTTDILKIRAMFGLHTGREIARLFDVSPTTIGDIQKGRLWRCVQ